MLHDPYVHKITSYITALISKFSQSGHKNKNDRAYKIYKFVSTNGNISNWLAEVKE